MIKINIIQYLEETVKRVPDKKAVVDGVNEITFEEFRKKAKSLALQLSNLNCFNKPIAVFLPKSIDSILANAAITYSGNAYMNLDTKTPSPRIGNILERIKPVLIITNNVLAGFIREIDSQLPLLLIEEVDFEKTSSEDLLDSNLQRIIDTDPLCIINTSGSTGTPKGVVLNHKSFIDFTEWAIDTLKIGEDEIIGSLSPLVFDIYSFELCMMMAKGSTIVLLPDSYAPFPARILTLMQEKKVTFLFWVPTIMVNIANMDLLSKIPLADLRMVWFAGEVFPTKQFNYWKKQLSSVKFVNLYGPIEITLDCTYFIVDREINDDEPIPIGFPCRNTDILILNDKDELSGLNEDGELCVRGTSLAMGYYNNPVKTASAFVQNPLNTSYPELIYRTGDIVFKNERGEIIFKGRKDSLVKHLGYRIELGEIEHVIINTLKLVENGCIVYNYKKKEITLFYECDEVISIREMKKAISEAFPKYMIPTVFYKMDILPRNTNGKIDRLFLSNKINNG
jgi:amino acid adenylation domain-containing protein